MKSIIAETPPANVEDELSRIGVAIPASLLADFDQMIEQKGYANRSEAFRDLMRDALTTRTVANPKTEVVGTLTLVYDHHVRKINDRLVGMQHQHSDQIISTSHIHLDHHNCLEVIILRGKAAEVQEIADLLIATKGIRHGKLTVTTATAS